MVNLNWQPGMTLEGIEKEAILQAFRFFRGNKTSTSIALGIAIRTLDSKLERYQVESKQQEIDTDDRRKRQENHLARARGLTPPVIQGEKQNSAPSGKDVSGTETGIHIQSITETSEKHAMSVSIGKEVQTLPSKQAPHGHSRKAR